MRLKFTKMHGLGNDFMVVDAVTQKVFFNPEFIRRLSDRHFGIGFDQLLVVEPPYDPDQDFHYRIYNADGGEVQMCGNGARCFAVFVRQKRLTDKKVLHVSTMAGPIVLTVRDDEQVTVNMGVPEFDPAKIPFRAREEQKMYMLSAAGENLLMGCVSMGNPHCTIKVDDVDTAPVEKIGSALQSSERFPEKVNVGFMQVVSRGEIRLRVFERGAGETLACGTGSCGAVANGINQGLLDSRVIVHLRGGDLDISWEGRGHPVMMTGPAESVYDGEINI